MSKVAVITGGASGIGLAITARLARKGYRVAALDVQEEALDTHVAALRSEGLQVSGHHVDVCDRSAVDAAITRARDEHGPIQIVVTSAGISAPESFTSISVEQWNHTIDVNLNGTFHSIQPVIPDMVEAGWGRIVTISSTAAQAGAPGRAHYCASKGAVIALTKALAAEYGGNGITVNTIPPSLVDTPMARKAEADGSFPSVDALGAASLVKRAGTGTDIAAACEFLCSDEAGFITGQQINVNGGWYM